MLLYNFLYFYVQFLAVPDEGTGRKNGGGFAEYLYRSAEFPYESGEEEESQASRYYRRNEEHYEVDMEQTARNGKNLIWQWRKSGSEYHPEVIFVVQLRDLVERLLREYVIEEEVGYGRMFAGRGLPKEIPESISANSTENGTQETYGGKIDRALRRTYAKCDEQHIGRHREKRRFSKCYEKQREYPPFRFAP